MTRLMRDDESRAVITGMGVVTTMGDGVDQFASALAEGRSGLSNWKRVRDPRLACKVVGDLGDFELGEHLATRGAAYPQALVQLAKKLLRATPSSGQLTAVAALQAYVDAGIDARGIDPERFGHVSAAHNVCMPYIAENVRTYDEEPEFIEPLFGMLALDTDVVAVTSELLHLKGPSYLVGGACASGNMAVISALDQLRTGRADAALVTGAPISLEPVALHGWTMIEALTYRSFNDDPTRASRPFDARREGFAPAEGAGALVIETLASAKRRGATIRAEILGGAASSDACRLTKPHQEGQERAMRAALRDARVDVERVDYVNAHATSTPLGDAVEVEAIKSVFGTRAYQIPVNGTKSMLGHCLTAAGVIELIATVVQMERGWLHPTINQEEPDPALDLDFVANTARDARIDIAISNSFGFGGINSCVVVGRAP
jgi:3-oxoacyl-(acyl-carrier-protein) synthase